MTLLVEESTEQSTTVFLTFDPNRPKRIISSAVSDFLWSMQTTM